MGFGGFQECSQAARLFKITRADLAQRQDGATAQIQRRVRIQDEIEQTARGFGGQ